MSNSTMDLKQRLQAIDKLLKLADKVEASPTAFVNAWKNKLLNQSTENNKDGTKGKLLIDATLLANDGSEPDSAFRYLFSSVVTEDTEAVSGFVSATLHEVVEAIEAAAYPGNTTYLVGVTKQGGGDIAHGSEQTLEAVVYGNHYDLRLVVRAVGGAPGPATSVTLTSATEGVPDSMNVATTGRRAAVTFKHTFPSAGQYFVYAGQVPGPDSATLLEQVDVKVISVT